MARQIGLAAARVPEGGEELQAPFGLRVGRLWSPLEVASGAQCGCQCPGCGAALFWPGRAREGGDPTLPIVEKSAGSDA